MTSPLRTSKAFKNSCPKQVNKSNPLPILDPGVMDEAVPLIQSSFASTRSLAINKTTNGEAFLARNQMRLSNADRLGKL